MLQDQTKELFARELEQMLREMPLAKVRVGDLCQRCGASRQTFYYHFRDKYDVVAWIFERDYRLAERAAGSEDNEIVAAETYRRMWERRDFYRVAFSDSSQNSITEYIHAFDVKLMKRIASRYMGTDAFTDQQIFEIKHHSYGEIGCVMEWLRGEIEATPEQLAAWETSRMPAFVGEAYRAK